MTDTFNHRPAARECELVRLVVSEGSTESRRAAGSAQRLEDVEKVVRKLETLLMEMHQWVFDCNEALCGRLEAIEDTQGLYVQFTARPIPGEHE